MVFPQWALGFSIGKSIAEGINYFAPLKKGSGDTWQKFLIDLRLHRGMQRVEIMIYHEGPYERLDKWNRYTRTCRIGAQDAIFRGRPLPLRCGPPTEEAARISK